MPFIYVVHEREFRRFNEPIWKVGYTDQTIEQRLRGYTRDSIAILTAAVSDGRGAEAMLLKFLDDAPSIKCRRDIGREYYEGPLTSLAVVFGSIMTTWCSSIPMSSVEESVDVVEEIIGGNDDDSDEDDNEDNDEVSEEDSNEVKMDALGTVLEFVSDKSRDLHNTTIAIPDLFGQFCDWTVTKIDKMDRCARSLGVGGFVARLRQTYRVRPRTIEKDGFVVAAVKFPPLRTDMPVNTADDSENSEEDEGRAFDPAHLTMWLNSHIQASPKGVVWEKQLRDLYNPFANQEGFRNVKKKVFKKALKTWMTRKGYSYKGQTTVSIAPKKYSRARDVWSGCKLV
jgi:hypothetical protein